MVTTIFGEFMNMTTGQRYTVLTTFDATLDSERSGATEPAAFATACGIPLTQPESDNRHMLKTADGNVFARIR